MKTYSIKAGGTTYEVSVTINAENKWRNTPLKGQGTHLIGIMHPDEDGSLELKGYLLGSSQKHELKGDYKAVYDYALTNLIN